MENKLKVNMNEYLPLRDVVFNTLRQAILKGELEPGERLMEIQLADRLGVSRTPIREAIRRSLEELAIELACQRMTESDIKELEEAQEAFRAAIHSADAMTIAETDEHYHDIIYNGTGNNRLVQILNNLREQMYRYRLEYIKDADKRQILVVEHDYILKAIRSRHVAEAKKAIREHIDNQEITVSKNIKEQQ